MHAIVSLEEGPPECDQRPIGRMIDRFDPRDAAGKIRVGTRDVRDQLLLRHARPHDENCARLCKRVCDALEERLVHRNMAAIARIGLVVQVIMRMAAVDRRTLGLGCVEIENSCLMVVEPDEQMIVLTHVVHSPVKRRRPVCAAIRDLTICAQASAILRTAAPVMHGVQSHRLHGDRSWHQRILRELK